MYVRRKNTYATNSLITADRYVSGFGICEAEHALMVLKIMFLNTCTGDGRRGGRNEHD